jgi:hypothetical protein
MFTSFICLILLTGAGAGFALYRARRRDWLRDLDARRQARLDWQASVIESQCFYKHDADVRP